MTVNKVHPATGCEGRGGIKASSTLSLPGGKRLSTQCMEAEYAPGKVWTSVVRESVTDIIYLNETCDS